MPQGVGGQRAHPGSFTDPPKGTVNVPQAEWLTVLSAEDQIPIGPVGASVEALLGLLGLLAPHAATARGSMAKGCQSAGS